MSVINSADEIGEISLRGLVNLLVWTHVRKMGDVFLDYLDDGAVIHRVNYCCRARKTGALLHFELFEEENTSTSLLDL